MDNEIKIAVLEDQFEATCWRQSWASANGVKHHAGPTPAWMRSLMRSEQNRSIGMEKQISIWN